MISFLKFLFSGGFWKVFVFRLIVVWAIVYFFTGERLLIDNVRWYRQF